MNSFLRSLAVFSLMGCASKDVVPIQGTTARIDAASEIHKEQSNLNMIIMSSPEECEMVAGNLNTAEGQREYEACLPWIDRSAGEVKLSARFELQEEDYYLPDLQDNLLVSIDNGQVLPNLPTSGVKVTGHKEKPIKQLFILLIDASGSMATVDNLSSNADQNMSRMDKVMKALQLPSVQNAFFPKEVDNSVVLYTFTNRVQPLGGSVEILRNKRSFAKAVKQLSVDRGFTHLYQSLSFAMTNIMEDPNIVELLDGETKPTIVLLTDGFNNEAQSDKCSDNISRLQDLLNVMNLKMKNLSMDTPSVFTVGLGRALDPNFEPALPKNQRPSVENLCKKPKGVSYPEPTLANAPIDASGSNKGLEDSYIDNISLEMMAYRGKGKSFISRDSQGLGQAFEKVAAIRYQWFEVQFRDDPLRLRKDFKVDFKLTSYANAMSFINIYPNAWIDGPSGNVDAQGWSKRGSVLHSTTIVTSGIGVLLFLMISGSAFFNIRRMLMGRLKRK